MDFHTSIRGLSNDIGSNNCFLNVILQSFWHLPSFKSAFQVSSYDHAHSPTSSSCFICELRALLIDYEYSDNATVNVSKVRSALEAISTSFTSNSKGCAVEVFEDILQYFHSLSDTCPSKCYAHKVFGYDYCEELSCDCNKSFGEKLTDFIVRTYITELFQISQNSKVTNLDVLLGISLASQSHARPCQNCGKLKFFKKLIIEKPKVLSLSFIWGDTSPKLINWFASLIVPVILLRNLFSLSSDQPDYFSRYILKGLIVYTASHYVAFFYSLRRNVWIEFDDSRVEIIYDWSEILGKIMKGKMLPVLMFYELDSELDKFKREYQLEFIENDSINYLLDPDVYFESFTDILSLDIAGISWTSDLIEYKDSKKCVIF